MPISYRKQLHPRIRLPSGAYEDPDALYLVTACAYDRKPLFVEDAMAREMVRLLSWLRARRGTRIFAYCFMPDHLHLLLSPAAGDGLSTLIHAYKTRTTERSWQLGHAGKLWQKRFHDSILRPNDNGIDAVEYVLDNPVRSGLVAERRQYPYSGTPDVLDSRYRGPAG